MVQTKQSTTHETQNTEGTMAQTKQSTTLAEKSVVKMILHSARNPKSQVHGILVGRFIEGPTLCIEDVIPLFHSSPTKPILDIALRIAEAHLRGTGDGKSFVVGWYTANERLGDDERPGQAALRIIGSIASRLDSMGKGLPAHAEAALILISNSGLAEMLCDKNYRTPSVISIFGRDSRKHWVQRVPDELKEITGEGGSKGSWETTGAIALAACGSNGGAVSVYDFEDHLDGGEDAIRSTDWLVNPSVAELVSKSG